MLILMVFLFLWIRLIDLVGILNFFVRVIVIVFVFVVGVLFRSKVLVFKELFC